MDFDYSPRQKEWIKRVSDFMDAHIYPAEETYAAQMTEAMRALEQGPMSEGELAWMRRVGTAKHGR